MVPVAGATSIEGQVVTLSLVTTIVHHADDASRDLLHRAGLLADER